MIVITNSLLQTILLGASLPRLIMNYHMKKDLLVKPFRLVFNEFSADDTNKRSKACASLLQEFPTALRRENVFFTDECAFYYSMCKRNVVFWPAENSHLILE